MARDFVNALAEFKEGIGNEACADSIVGRSESLATIFAQVVTSGRDAQIHSLTVAQNGVQTKPAIARLPMVSVLMIAYA